MKILMTTEWYLPTINGAIVSIVTLKEALEKLGHEVKILTLADKHFASQSDDVYAVSSYGAGKIYPGARFTLSADDEILAEIIRWKPDIIHTQCEFSTFRIAKQLTRMLNIPIVHTYHTVYEDYTHYFSPNKLWGKKMVSYFSKRVLRNTETVIVPTEKVYHLLKEYGVLQPITVVPTGIKMEKFQHLLTDEEKIELRNQYNIPKDNSLLISTGRLAKEKNVEELIYYLAKLNNPNLSLLIVGDGPYRPFLEALVSELGMEKTILFTGMVCPEEISAYYQIGDLFVSASMSETQGLSYIEALASGTPALCRKDPCLKEVIHDGINGYQYASFNQFEEYLNSILSNRSLRKQFSENAVRIVRENYSSESFGKKIEEVYTEVLYQDRFKQFLTG